MAWLNFISTELRKSSGPLFDSRFEDQAKELFKTRLTQRYELVASALEHQSYLMGKDFSVADAYLFTVTSWARRLDVDLSPWPRVQRYQEEIAARAGVREALRREGLLQAG